MVQWKDNIVNKYLCPLSFVIITIMTLTSSIVHSDDWVCYSWNDNGKECRQYYDKKIQHTKDVARVSTKLPITSQIRKTITRLKSSDSYMIVSKLFDCRKATVSVIKTTVHKKDGGISSSVIGDMSVKHQIDPDSRDGVLFEIVCKKGKQTLI